MYSLVACITFTTLYNHYQSLPSFHNVYKYQIIIMCTPKRDLLYVNYTSVEKKKDFSVTNHFSRRISPHSTHKHHLLELLIQESLMFLQILLVMARMQSPNLLFAQAVSQNFICSKQP